MPFFSYECYIEVEADSLEAADATMDIVIARLPDEVALFSAQDAEVGEEE